MHKSQAGIKIAWRNINIHRYEDYIALIAESKEELKSLLVRKGYSKTGLKHKHSNNYSQIYSQHSWHLIVPHHGI